MDAGVKMEMQKDRYDGQEWIFDPSGKEDESMITDFNKVKKDAEEAREYKKKRAALLAEWDEVNPDDVAVGKVILLTGETFIDGVDYGMKKQYFIEQALKSMDIEERISALPIPDAVRKNMRVLE